MPEVSVDKAIAAVHDCARATSPDGVDSAVLLDLGWQQATAEADNGDPIDLENLIILGKEEVDSPLVLTGRPGSEANGVCAITGALDPASGFDGLLAAMGNEFKAIESSDGDHPFRVGRGFAITARTGNGDTFRIAVLEPGDS